MRCSSGRPVDHLYLVVSVCVCGGPGRGGAGGGWFVLSGGVDIYFWISNFSGEMVLACLYDVWLIDFSDREQGGTAQLSQRMCVGEQERWRGRERERSTKEMEGERERV